MGWTITQIAFVVLCAMGAGLAFSCFGYTPVLGYIIAGLLLGPSVFSVISNVESITICSEMGIIFLLFVIGQGLSFEKIKHIWKTSVLITVASTVCTYGILLVIGSFFKINHSLVVLCAFCITLSSTAVTVKSLDTLNEKGDSVEENTFGILIAQDLIALVMVLIINVLARKTGVEISYKSPRLIALMLFSIGLFLYFSNYNTYVHKTTNFIKRHKDMLSIVVFGICLGCAVLAELVGFSAPFGAFIAGLVLGNSNLKEEVKNVSSPIEEIFLMTFFLSVGLLVDIKFIWHNLGMITLALIYITVGKTIMNIGILRLFKFSMKDSFIISVLLGHIGEFSFMLAFAANKLELIREVELKFLVSLTALSLFLSPFWLIFAERCRLMTNNAINSSAWEFFQLIVSKEEKKAIHIANSLGKNSKSILTFIKSKIELLMNFLKKG